MCLSHTLLFGVTLLFAASSEDLIASEHQRSSVEGVSTSRSAETNPTVSGQVLNQASLAQASKKSGLAEKSAKGPVATTARLRLARSGKLHQRRPIRSGSVLPVIAANRRALRDPVAGGFMNGIQNYPFMEGAIYKLFTAPDTVSDIVLQQNEQLIAISAGDTTRWVIGDTYSGSGDGRHVHILVKPLLAGLTTNLVITTSIRTYHLQLDSRSGTAMAAISFVYPQDALMALKSAPVPAQVTAPVAPIAQFTPGLAIEALHFDYAITGDRPSWRPVQVFDDGRKVYIVFPETLDRGDSPPLFLIGPSRSAELVNYRQVRNIYVVDNLFADAELRLGAGPQTVVHIAKTVREGPFSENAHISRDHHD